jgi:hypothetical protein
LPKVSVVLTSEVVLEEIHHRIGSGTPQVLDPSGVHMLGPGHFAYGPSLRSAHLCLRQGAGRTWHAQALHDHSPIRGCQIISAPLASLRDEAAHLGVMPRH